MRLASSASDRDLEESRDLLGSPIDLSATNASVESSAEAPLDGSAALSDHDSAASDPAAATRGCWVPRWIVYAVLMLWALQAWWMFTASQPQSTGETEPIAITAATAAPPPPQQPPQTDHQPTLEPPPAVPVLESTHPNATALTVAADAPSCRCPASLAGSAAAAAASSLPLANLVRDSSFVPDGPTRIASAALTLSEEWEVDRHSPLRSVVVQSPEDAEADPEAVRWLGDQPQHQRSRPPSPFSPVLRFTSGSVNDSVSVVQLVRLSSLLPRSLNVSVWVRGAALDRTAPAAAAASRPSSDLSLYVDAWFEDGSTLWGTHLPIESGTFDWRLLSGQMHFGRPVKSLRLYVLMRFTRGTLWITQPSITHQSCHCHYRDESDRPAGEHGGSGTTSSLPLIDVGAQPATPPPPRMYFTSSLGPSVTADLTAPSFALVSFPNPSGYTPPSDYERLMRGAHILVLGTLRDRHGGYHAWLRNVVLLLLQLRLGDPPAAAGAAGLADSDSAPLPIVMLPFVQPTDAAGLAATPAPNHHTLLVLCHNHNVALSRLQDRRSGFTGPILAGPFFSNYFTQAQQPDSRLHSFSAEGRLIVMLENKGQLRDCNNYRAQYRWNFTCVLAPAGIDADALRPTVARFNRTRPLVLHKSFSQRFAHEGVLSAAMTAVGFSNWTWLRTDHQRRWVHRHEEFIEALRDAPFMLTYTPADNLANYIREAHAMEVPVFLISPGALPLSYWSSGVGEWLRIPFNVTTDTATDTPDWGGRRVQEPLTRALAQFVQRVRDDERTLEMLTGRKQRSSSGGQANGTDGGPDSDGPSSETLPLYYSPRAEMSRQLSSTVCAARLLQMLRAHVALHPDLLPWWSAQASTLRVRRPRDAEERWLASIAEDALANTLFPNALGPLSFDECCRRLAVLILAAPDVPLLQLVLDTVFAQFTHDAARAATFTEALTNEWKRAHDTAQLGLDTPTRAFVRSCICAFDAQTNHDLRRTGMQASVDYLGALFVSGMLGAADLMCTLLIIVRDMAGCEELRVSYLCKLLRSVGAVRSFRAPDQVRLRLRAWSACPRLSRELRRECNTLADEQARWNPPVPPAKSKKQKEADRAEAVAVSTAAFFANTAALVSSNQLTNQEAVLGSASPFRHPHASASIPNRSNLIAMESEFPALDSIADAVDSPSSSRASSSSSSSASASASASLAASPADPSVGDESWVLVRSAKGKAKGANAAPSSSARPAPRVASSAAASAPVPSPASASRPSVAAAAAAAAPPSASSSQPRLLIPGGLQPDLHPAAPHRGAGGPVGGSHAPARAEAESSARLHAQWPPLPSVAPWAASALPASPAPSAAASSADDGLSVSDSICVVCVNNPRVCVLLPCRHFKLCMECAHRIDQCPICRAKIAQRMELFV